MPTLNTMCYCGLGPGDTAKVPILQKSGVKTVIEWALHIGRDSLGPQKFGDFVLNGGYPKVNDPFISQGKFNPQNNAQIKAWPNDLARLKQSGGIEKIFFSIGGQGDPVFDFTTVQYMLDNGMAKILQDNFTTLRKQFPAVDGIDLDCEEFGFSPRNYPKLYPISDANLVGPKTISQLGQILFDAGFEVTFCPAYPGDRDTWQMSMQLLSNAGHTVSAWNLQCYSGGEPNRRAITNWLKAIAAVKLPKSTFIGNNAGAYLVPGLAVQNQHADNPDPQCPAGKGGMCLTFADMNKQGRDANYIDLAGGFLWTFEQIVSNNLKCGNSVPAAQDYVKAIINGLSNKCS